MIHGVDDSHSGSDGSAWRIYVQENILFGVFGFQEKKLGDDDIGRVIVNRSGQKDNALS